MNLRYKNITDHVFPLTMDKISNFAQFGTGRYKRLTMLKMDFVIDILSLGFDVFFMDTDIGFFEDPIPSIYQGCDVMFQNNFGNGGSNHLYG